jgi:hypothetical protein
MTSRIKLRVGEIEIEYEGDPKVLTIELPKLLKAINEANPGFAGAAPRGSTITGDALSVTTVAQKLGAHKLPDLIIAAAMALTGRGSKAFDKKDLRKEMRDATGFYKGAMANNFDNALNRLAKTGRITHSGGSNYALPPTQIDSLMKRLKA